MIILSENQHDKEKINSYDILSENINIKINDLNLYTMQKKNLWSITN